ncbi:MAG TPA: tryptophan--tRNA ligase [Firmicutes bacterium]|jgi:tryptophanyl-tRNA synthetase|nr:tryptophan--tRNA ligase [Bacillota bacterium]
MKKRVFSGVQPSGSLTIGNYLGAIRNFAHLQHEADCFFCVVDLHSLTVPQDPVLLRENIKNTARLFVAAGIDPQVSTVFVQSQVSAHAELSWLLECQTYIGELRRMTQFKDKSQKQEIVSSGLLTYPVLMAADILLYNTDLVPVGEDQKQHLEITRDLAIRINNRFQEEVFKVPEPYIPPRSSGGRIMSLTDPEEKMSKSASNPKSFIALLDPPEVIKKKIMSAVTDSDSVIRYDEENKPAVSNLMVIYSLCSGESIEEITQNYASYGYGKFKKDLAELVVETLRPIQNKVNELSAPGAIESILMAGAAKAQEAAQPKLRLFQNKLGLFAIQS